MTQRPSLILSPVLRRLNPSLTDGLPLAEVCYRMATGLHVLNSSFTVRDPKRMFACARLRSGVSGEARGIPSSEGNSTVPACARHSSRHGNNPPVCFPAIARSELIAAFAGLTRIGIKVRIAINTIRLTVGRSWGAIWAASAKMGTRHVVTQAIKRIGASCT